MNGLKLLVVLALVGFGYHPTLDRVLAEHRASR
jgi:hypothetical protein